MKQPGVLLEHGGETYLLVDGGFNESTRVITLLATPESRTFRLEEGVRPVTWRDQGEWFPVARWDEDELMMQSPTLEEQHQLALEIIQHHIAEQPPLPDAAWVNGADDRYVSTLEDVLPMGLAVSLFDSLEAAEAAGADLPAQAIQNVPQFLTHLARQGYAGAMWNASLPVFFCIDEAGDLQFLRVRRGDGTVEMDLLDTDGTWQDYDGAEEVGFLDHRDACDRRLAEALGRQPLIHWPEDGTLWSVGPDIGEPGLVTSDEDSVDYGIVFTDELAAQAWCEDAEESWGPFPVDDLVALLRHPALEGRGSLLNPGQHRVRSGVLWCDGEKTILDSYGGFWLLKDGGLEPVG